VTSSTRTALLMCLALTGCHKADIPPAQAAPAPPAARGGASSTPETTPTADDQAPAGMFDMINQPDTTVLHAVDPKTLTESQRKYGISPRRSSAVEYQPDVLIMEHGDEAIRSWAKDGMTWQFDAHAPQVDQFKEGKIIFATGMAAGRIISLKQSEGMVTVVLGPIQLTDVIKNGKFAMNEPIDVSHVIAYTAPDFPQPKETTTAFGSKTAGNADDTAHFYDTAFYPAQLQVTPGITQIPQPPFQLPPIPSADSLGNLPVVNIDDDVRTVPIFTPGRVGAQIYYYKKGGPSVFAEGAMSIRKLQVRFDLDIQNGTIIQCGIAVDGALGLTVKMGAITYGKDFRVNFNRMLWLPLDLKIPLGLNGAFPVPFSVTFNTMLQVNTGFSAKNASLDAEGDYTFGGGLWAGYKKNGGWQVSTSKQVSAAKDLGVTTKGLSVGINSLVVAASERVMVGIGAFGFNTGVYGGLRFGATILDAPTTGWACRQGTIEAHFDSGVGYSLPPGISEIINALLKFFTSYQLDRVGTILTGPTEGIFHGITQIPAGCATQKAGAT
jgi:hypothetical protein